MGQIRTQQNQVARLVVADMVADKAPPAATFDQGEFEFGVAMPIEREPLVGRPAKYHEGLLIARLNGLKTWFH